MKITFFSNFMNHHQLPFCQALIDIIGDDFTFVATEPVPNERLMMGYLDINSHYNFVIRTYEDEKELIKARKLAIESDVMIIGSAPVEFLDLRMQYNKLTFQYTERILKKGVYRRFIPSIIKKVKLKYKKYIGSNYYFLCASAYTAYDLSLFGVYEKMIKWGYFPEFREQNISELFNKKRHECINVLWAGRLLDWKRTKDAILVANHLKGKQISFKLNIIGTGPCENKLKSLVEKLNLKEYVFFLGSMSPDLVREYMESANIFLFTSNFYEGWGAVLNEAMNSGCAIVASHAIGSVPYLIKDCYNGLVYKYGDLKDLYSKVENLISNEEYQNELGVKAYETIRCDWNAKSAAIRLIAFIQEIEKSQQYDLFQDGPCSKSLVICNNWYEVNNNV